MVDDDDGNNVIMAMMAFVKHAQSVKQRVNNIYYILIYEVYWYTEVLIVGTYPAGAFGLLCAVLLFVR